jgi:hypothetical protein
MLKQIRSGLTYANVMSTLAVFLILGGASAFAASQLAKNSIGSKQLKKSSVTAVKIKDGAINSAKVADESLTGADVAKASLPGDKIADGSLTGAHLADGSVGPADLAPNSVNSSKVVAGTFLGGKVTTQFEQAAVALADGQKGSYDVFCPEGQIGIGGGGRGDANNSELTNFSSSRPAISTANTEPPLSGQSFSGWRITVSNPVGGAAEEIKPEVWAICAALP